MSGLDVTTLREEAALLRLVPEWWALWERCADATPFQTPAWLVPWWQCFHPGALRVVTVRAAGRLVGVAPLYLEEGPQGRRLLPLGMSLSDDLDVLVDPMVGDVSPAMLAAIVGEATRIDFEELRPAATALGIATPPGWRNTIAVQSACPVLDLDDPTDGLPAAMPPLKRRKLRMARRRTARRDGRVETASPETADVMLDALVRLHAARWQARGEPGVLADVTVQQFHRLALTGLMRHGLARLVGLWIGDVIAGVYYGFAHGPRAYAYLGGFDPAFGFESPGTVLIGHAIEAAVAGGAREFHFLRGQEPYKYEWGAFDRWNSRRILEPVL